MNKTDPYYTRRQRSDRWSIERVGVLTVVDTGDWPDTPSSPVYIVHQATPRRSTSPRHSSISTSRSNTTVGATPGAKDVRMSIPKLSSSVQHSGDSTNIVSGTTRESLISRTTMSACIGTMLDLRANPSPRSSLAS
jgi:hypothetical protein